MAKNEIYGVIDVGSNSVRALVYSGGKILYTGLITSRLGEGLAKTDRLSAEPMLRTFNAIKTLINKCASLGADKPFVFATEAVRSAENAKEFLSLCAAEGIEIDVLSGDEEAEIGLIGALDGKDGGIIDIGGASTEIAVSANGKIVYSHSLPLGAVRLTDLCGEDEKLLDKSINARISEYGELPKGIKYCFIGGTSTAIAMVVKGVKAFNAEKIDGAVIDKVAVAQAFEIIKNTPKELRAEKFGISEKRAEVIVAGACMIKALFERFGFDEVIVKTNDNMLGYIKKRVNKGGKL